MSNKENRIRTHQEVRVEELGGKSKDEAQIKVDSVTQGDGAATQTEDLADQAAKASVEMAAEETSKEITGDPEIENDEGQDFKPREDMPLDKQIKNLQVSISIYRKEIKEKLSLMPTMKAEEKAKVIARIAICDKQITEKETELAKLKELWAKEKPGRASRSVEVTPEEVAAVMAKYGISK